MFRLFSVILMEISEANSSVRNKRQGIICSSCHSYMMATELTTLKKQIYFFSLNRFISTEITPEILEIALLCPFSVLSCPSFPSFLPLTSYRGFIHRYSLQECKPLTRSGPEISPRLHKILGVNSNCRAMNQFLGNKATFDHINLFSN